MLHYDLRGISQLGTRADDAGPRQILSAAIVVRALIGRRFGYFAGVDLAAGATRPGGFAYSPSLIPVGIGVRFGRRSLLAIGSGVSAIGATAGTDDAVVLFTELHSEIALTDRLRFLLRGSVGYALAGDSSHPQTVDATLALRLGHSFDRFGATSSNGYYVGIALHEFAGLRFIGMAIGYSLDAHISKRLSF
jgi:hypothetical protein